MNVLEIRGTVDAWLDKDDRKLICIEFYSRAYSFDTGDYILDQKTASALR